MVQDVKKGTCGWTAGMRFNHFLELLDGKPSDDVKALCRYLHNRQGEKITVAMKTNSKNYLSYIIYLLEELFVSNLSLIGYRI